MTQDRTSHLMITSQTRNHSDTEPTLKDPQSNSLLTLKYNLYFQMTEQSYPSLFTVTIGFTVCNSDCKPVSGEKLTQAISAIQGPFPNFLEQS